jgi:hypothetical protein
LCILGNALPTRFGRNQQTNLNKVITISRNAVAATPLDGPGRLDSHQLSRVLII